MADKKVPNISKDDVSSPALGGDFLLGKFILLRDCLKDIESDDSQLRNIIMYLMKYMLLMSLI